MLDYDPTAEPYHETVLDTRQEQVATVYAKALLGAAESAGQTETVLEELDSLVNDVLEKLPRLAEVFSSALVAHEEKVAMLDRALAGKASPLFLDFLKVLSAHGRLSHLRAIHRATRELYDQMRGRVRVQVLTATPLGEPLARKLTDRLRGMLGGEPVLERRVDPDVLGGMVLRVGDTVYDASVARQLEQVRHQMINRSIHEIQSRRNRFRDPEGD